MKKIFLTLIALFSLSALQAWEEQVEFTLDGRDWKKGFEKSAGRSFIVELVLPNETVENWSELVVVQMFPPLPVAFEEYYSDFMSGLKKAAPRVESRILAQDANSMIFEWWIHDGSSLAQHEWFKVMKTSNATHVFRYVTKKINEVEAIRPTWEKIVKEAKVVQTSK